MVFLGVILIVLLSLALGVLLFTWPAMIMFGVVHSFWGFIPAFGFWQTFALVVLAKILTANVSVNNS